jgi:hypothetical protein
MPKRIKAYHEAGHLTDFGFALIDEVGNEVDKLLRKCIATGVHYDDLARMIKNEVDYNIVLTRLQDIELNPPNSKQPKRITKGIK